VIYENLRKRPPDPQRTTVEAASVRDAAVTHRWQHPPRRTMALSGEAKGHQSIIIASKGRATFESAFEGEQPVIVSQGHGHALQNPYNTKCSRILPAYVSAKASGWW
jgi:hypothetical protein